MQISVANVQGIGSIPTIRRERKIGMLPETTMAEIRCALCFFPSNPGTAGSGNTGAFPGFLGLPQFWQSQIPLLVCDRSSGER
jgi:mRNA interferase MazF